MFSQVSVFLFVQGEGTPVSGPRSLPRLWFLVLSAEYPLFLALVLDKVGTPLPGTGQELYLGQDSRVSDVMASTPLAITQEHFLPFWIETQNWQYYQYCKCWQFMKNSFNSLISSIHWDFTLSLVIACFRNITQSWQSLSDLLFVCFSLFYFLVLIFTYQLF